VHEYNYRYALPALPLACMAAALAFRSRPAAVTASSGDPSLDASTGPVAVTADHAGPGVAPDSSQSAVQT
jgi:hypothetical protein